MNFEINILILWGTMHIFLESTTNTYNPLSFKKYVLCNIHNSILVRQVG
jgi:hypothetical protein